MVKSYKKKAPGIKLLQDTYRYRLETYCGITEQIDKDTLQFMLHRTLGNNVQADYYRSFTRESGVNQYWIPGGFTSGGMPEAVVDQILPGTYVIEKIIK